MPSTYQFGNEEHFRSVIQNIDGYIYTAIYENGDAIASYHSPKCLDITGYLPEEYAADHDLWIKMVYPEDRNLVYLLFKGRNDEAPQTYLEHRIYRKDGALRWISNTFTEQFDANGLLSRRDGIIADITGRKSAELALQEQNFFFQKLLDAIPNPVFYKNTEGKYEGCNQAFEAYIGKQQEEIIGKTAFDVLSKNEAENFTEMDRDLYEKGGIQVYESTMSHADGSTRRLMFNKALFTNTENSVAGMVGILVDITRIKEIEEELYNTNKFLQELQNIVNKSPAIVFLRRASESYQVELVSENISLLGFSRGYFTEAPRNYLDMVYPGDRNRFVQSINKFIAKKAIDFTQEYRLVLNNGKVAWVDDHIWVRYDDNGFPTHLHGIVIDISKRKQAVQMFRESIERYKVLAENSYDLICEISHDVRMLYISPNFSDTLGYHPDELINEYLFRFVHEDDIHGIKEELKKGFGQIIHRFRHKNGSWIWFESAGKQYITAEGEKRGVIVSRDVTSKRKLEQQIIRSEKLLAIGEMSAMIAHEFRNALTSIKMILQLMKESPRLSKRDKRSLTIALHSIYHMEIVIRQLLNFSQPTTLTMKPVDLNTLLLECLPFIRIQAQKKDIKLSKIFSAGIPELMINEQALKETIVNLLINATHAFEAESIKLRRHILIKTEIVKIDETMTDIDIGVENEYFKMDSSLPQQEIIIEKGTDCVVIKVYDNGCGIPEDHLPHLFEPFFTTKEKGSGLGLAIAKRTVNAHGGIMLVKSKLGKGTMFSIFFPLPQKN